MKLRIVVRPLGSLSKVRYRNFRDKRRPSARAAGYQVRITRTLVCRSAGGLCSGSKSTLPHEVEGAPLMRLIGCAVLIGLVLAIAPAQAQLSGHGGPIRALAISADGATALSGSFDTSAIRWLLRRNTADQVLRLHQSAVNAVAILADGRAITAGEDAHIAIWTPGKQQPDMVLEGVVTNVTKFGAFVDIGVHQDGLVHISELSNRFIKDPSEAVKAGQIVKVKVLSADLKAKRIALSMKALMGPARNNQRPKQPDHQPPSQPSLNEKLAMLSSKWRVS